MFPKDIEVIANPISSYNALSQKLMASIQANNQPDIAQVYESRTAKYIEAGVLCNLEDFMNADTTWTKDNLEDIHPVFLKSNTFNDTIYSFPFNKSVRAYFYNKDAFYRAGLDPNHFPPIGMNIVPIAKSLHWIKITMGNRKLMEPILMLTNGNLSICSIKPEELF